VAVAAPAPSLAPASIAPASAALRFLPGVDVARLHALPFSEQVRSPFFYLYALVFLVFNLKFQTYLAGIGASLQSLGDDDGTFIRVFGAMLPPFDFASVVIAGLVLDGHGPVPTFMALSALCVTVSVVSLVPALAAQPLAFAAFAAFRGVLYATMSSYLALVFGFRHLGALVGTVTCLGGLFALQQVFWTRWALARGFGEPNALHVALGLATFAWPLWLRARSGAGPAVAAK
jgi:hypothetical protein